jgi:hypothetical protein
MKPDDLPPGIFVEKTAADVIADDRVTLAFVFLNKDGTISMNWVNFLFLPGPLAMGDVLRAELIRKLRVHADGLESREIDQLTRRFFDPGASS